MRPARTDPSNVQGLGMAEVERIETCIGRRCVHRKGNVELIHGVQFNECDSVARTKYSVA